MKKKRLIFIVSLCIICVFSSTMVLADYYSYGFKSGKLNYRITYNSGYGTLSQIKTSVQKWNGVSSNVKLTYTSSTLADISVDYMNVAPPSSTSLGLTNLYSNGNKLASPVAYWNGAVCIIYRNSSLINNSTAAKATCTHEVGHALSLSHTSGSKDIMKQGVKNYTNLSSNDKSWLQKKWGN